MKRLTYFIGLGVISSLLLLLSGSAISVEIQRTALVIGNANYNTSPLRNSINDAADMAAALKKLGFIVTLITDANLKKMERSVRKFGIQLRQGGVGLFYYAGHGIQVGGRNYLIPVDAVIASESDVKYETMDAGRVLGKMEDAHNDVNIIILDACRDNPFGRGFRSYTRGLARIDAPSGSILAFATAPGDVAADGSGRNGLYTSKLLQHMAAPGRPIEQVFKNVRKDVVSASGGSQIPWESSSLISDFYFVSPGKTLQKSLVQKKAYNKPPNVQQSGPQKQVVAAIPSLKPQSKLNLRKKPLEILKYNSIKNMIFMYNFFESANNRSGRFENKFVDNKDGTITDLSTGLIWEKSGSIKTLNDYNAKQYVKRLNRSSFAGYSDWRIPTVEELASILHHIKSDKGVYLAPLFSASQKRCWTIDGAEVFPYFDQLKSTWIVDFSSGRIEASQKIKKATGAGLEKYERYKKNKVKAVRSIQ